MKQKLLLTLFIASINLAVNAQKTATYAITGSQKGQNNWTEVRLIDNATGDELKTIFKNSEETQPLNARTGKPVAKKEMKPENLQTMRYEYNGNVVITSGNNNVRIITTPEANGSSGSVRTIRVRPEVNITSASPLENNMQASKLKEEALLQGTKLREEAIQKAIGENSNVRIRINSDVNTNTVIAGSMGNADKKMQPCRIEVVQRMSPSLDKPFSTYSAACAYDKKHERLYYTPMGIAQLRYIDLKSKNPQVFYFEDEQFGALRNRGDVPNQITRMVIGADGNGYALTNNADHLIQFTTDKKAIFTDLGGLTDDAANGNFSVHSAGGYGGDIIAAKSGDLFLITANHNVFQIDIKNLAATYKGTIQGLPRGYSTNGAAVEDGSMVLVNSSNSTQGYYHFDMNNLVAEKVGNSESVFNASDLANANLLTIKKDKKEVIKEALKEVVPEAVAEIQTAKEKIIEGENLQETRIAVYPNPVTNHLVNLVLDNYTAGKYQARLIDVSGKQLSSKYFTINSKSHTEQYNLPQSIAKGNYLIQIYDQASKGAGVVKLIVQ